MIHPTAIIHPKAQVDSSVLVGPYAIVDEHVVVGGGCIVGPHVYLTGRTVIGKNNRFHVGSVIGDAPQDLRYKDEPTAVMIGNHNTFREHTTVHRSNKVDEPTVIGSHNFLMAHSHIGHNSMIGNHIIIANGALLGGHVTVEDRAFISGNCLVHQFVRIGTLSLMQGGAGISKDLPPYTIASEVNNISGLNVVGLRRAGIPSAARIELKRLYRAIFRSGSNIKAAVEEARKTYQDEAATLFLNFLAASKRGVCSERLRNAEAADDDTAG